MHSSKHPKLKAIPPPPPPPSQNSCGAQPEHDKRISDHVLRLHRYRGSMLDEAGGLVEEDDAPRDGDDDEETPMHDKFDRNLHGERLKVTDPRAGLRVQGSGAGHTPTPQLENPNPTQCSLVPLRVQPLSPCPLNISHLVPMLRPSPTPLPPPSLPPPTRFKLGPCRPPCRCIVVCAPVHAP